MSFGLFRSTITELVKYSPVSTAVFGVAAYMLLILPLYLYSFVAVNSLLTRRSTVGVYITAALLVSVLGAPASFLLWVSGPGIGVAAPAIAAIVLALPAFLLLARMRHTSVPHAGRTSLGIVLCLIGFLILFPSTVLWIMLPFSIAFLPFAGLFLVTGAIFSLAWWFLSQRSASDAPEANRRALTLIGLSVFIGLTAALAMHAVIRGRTRTITHQMEWESGGSRQSCGAPILLINRGCTALTQRVCSDEVARYLQSTGGRIVSVTYSAADDFGRVWSSTITQIGSVRVDFEADESIRKETDIDCIFHPEMTFERRPNRRR